MAQHKLAFYRYLEIDRILRSKAHRYPPKEYLLEVCQEKFGVRSISTIEKDLSTMRVDFDAPIVYSKKHKGYAYTDESYQFLGYNLSDDERHAMGFVESILQSFREYPIFEEFSSAVDKVLDGLQLTKNVGYTPRGMTQIIQIDKPPHTKGSEQLAPLLTHIQNRQVIQLSYKKHGEEAAKDYVLHPYLLKEYQDFWYLVGYVEGKPENPVRMFGVDRIQHVSPLAGKYHVPPQEIDFDAENFYGHCIGVTALNEKPEEVKLLFNRHLAPYVLAKPLHHTQQAGERHPDGAQEISLQVILNTELKNLVLGYGANVRVLAPESLCQAVRQTLQEALQQYEN